MPSKNGELLQIDNYKNGLFNMKALGFLLLWYFFSGCTLFLNKYILTYLNGNPAALGTSQMVMTTICGFLQLYFPFGAFSSSQKLNKVPGFYKHMTIVGCTRFFTVVLGLVALNYVAASFTETVKSSAPMFTVLISRFLLGEHTNMYVNLSLLPIILGLALCSMNETSFEIRGFLAALLANLAECLQNVYSKLLISEDKFKLSPSELQFYTSIASVVFQIPVAMLLVDFNHVIKIDLKIIFYFVLDGILFHFQSITAYLLMGYVSPLTHSVANTAKRAFLIWLSVLIFENEVTISSAIGTVTVIFGVLVYIKAQ